MRESLPVCLVPGLLCSARLYLGQLPTLWRFGPVTITDHTRADSLAGIVAQMLTQLPPRFALIGLSMGGYIAFEVMRQAPERVAKLALLDTAARPDVPEQTAQRRLQIELARTGRFGEVPDVLFPKYVAAARRDDRELRATVRTMAEETGADAFVRQQTAIMGRPDSRPLLPTIRCPTLVLVGEQDELTPPDRAAEMAALVPNARLVTVPECGHVATLEQPYAVSRALAELLGA
jgi:pimeloyl-ACP methyl ester carboxylesterase